MTVYIINIDAIDDASESKKLYKFVDEMNFRGNKFILISSKFNNSDMTTDRITDITEDSPYMALSKLSRGSIKIVEKFPLLEEIDGSNELIVFDLGEEKKLIPSAIISKVKNINTLDELLKTQEKILYFLEPDEFLRSHGSLLNHLQWLTNCGHRVLLIMEDKQEKSTEETGLINGNKSISESAFDSYQKCSKSEKDNKLVALLKENDCQYSKKLTKKEIQEHDQGELQRLNNEYFKSGDLKLSEIFQFLTSILSLDASSLSIREIGFVLIAIGVAGISVIPNGALGGYFAIVEVEAFLKTNIGKKLRIRLTENDYETIRVTFAAISAIVNFAINGRSAVNALDLLYKQLGNCLFSKEKIKSIAILAAEMIISGIATIPNFGIIQISIAELKNWSKEFQEAILVISTVSATTLNIRSAYNTGVFFKSKLFGSKERKVAALIRGALFNEKNKILQKNILVKHIVRLSEGNFYTDKYSVWLRNGILGTAAALPIAYSIGAYYFSSHKVMKEEVNPPDHENKLENTAITAVNEAINGISTLMRYVLLARLNYLTAEVVCNSRAFSEYALGDEKRTLLNEIGSIIAFSLQFGLFIGSLPGPAGAVLEFMFKDDGVFWKCNVSLVIAGVGCFINLKDLMDVNSIVYAKSKNYLQKIWQNELQKRETRYGQDPDSLIKILIKTIAMKSDADIIAEYTKKLDPQNTNNNSENLPECVSTLNDSLKEYGLTANTKLTNLIVMLQDLQMLTPEALTTCHTEFLNRDVPVAVWTSGYSEEHSGLLNYSIGDPKLKEKLKEEFRSKEKEEGLGVAETSESLHLKPANSADLDHVCASPT